MISAMCIDLMRKTLCVCVMVGVSLLLVVACVGIPKEALDEVSRPLPKDFLLGPEDVVEVMVWRNQDLSRTVVVRPDGMISLPLIGDVQASGLTASGVSEKISKRLSEYKENPSVSVSVKEINSYYIYVVGEFVHPGKYPLKSYTTVLQAVSLAGGFTQYASKNRMAVMRTIRTGAVDERHVRIPVRYDDLVMGKGEVGNFRLLTGDTIVVP
ncbi:MAG: polysaccharide biosynthesis/export family protein [Nitrospirota bacterium]|nr:polysaccharide biosynthesis/export family protein [Nitrospirota bacterium]MDP2382706.1 polysaccharide biosynthesis/export family protein [Nitrospirota bacterium]MDP3597107.1 polysaccharide biosynthesis/export family protein [Nitrospirota bacterium]